jgi:hypothetical protein
MLAKVKAAKDSFQYYVDAAISRHGTKKSTWVAKDDVFRCHSIPYILCTSLMGYLGAALKPCSISQSGGAGKAHTILEPAA